MKAWRGRKWRIGAIIVIALPFAWGLFVYVADWPMCQRRYSACAICRASKFTDYLFLLPVKHIMHEDEFSIYYRQHADPAHRHFWMGCGGSRTTRTSDMSAHGSPDPLRLHYNAALAILKSLPDPATRKAFFEHLCRSDRQVTNDWQDSSGVFNAIMQLNEAYWENERRTDWPEQVRKVGLYPRRPADSPSR
jgi:hypothetical protein